MSQAIHELAVAVADELFRNGAGEIATRLLIELPGPRHGGGWCYEAVVSHVEKVLSGRMQPVQPGRRER